MLVYFICEIVETSNMVTLDLPRAAASCVDASLLSSYSNVSVVPVTYCTNKNYVANQDNHAAIGLLLHVRHWALAGSQQPTDGNGRVPVATYGGSNKSGSMAKKQKNLTYDRIFTFADLRSNKGACFVVLTQSISESDHVLKFCRDDIAVGKVFVILEPDPVRRYLSSSLPLISSADPLIPLRMVSDHLHMVQPRIAKPGETLYFIQMNVPVKMSSVAIDERTCLCKGQLCDRQQKIESHKKGACGCLIVGRKPGFVINQTLFLQFPADFHAEYIDDDDIIEGGGDSGRQTSCLCTRL